MTRKLRVVEPKNIIFDMEEDLRGSIDLARAIAMMAEAMPKHIGGPTLSVAWALVDKLQATEERWDKLFDVTLRTAA